LESKPPALVEPETAKPAHAPFCAIAQIIQTGNTPSCAKNEKVKTRNEVNLTSDNYGALFAFIGAHRRLKIDPFNPGTGTNQRAKSVPSARLVPRGTLTPPSAEPWTVHANIPQTLAANKRLARHYTANLPSMTDKPGMTSNAVLPYSYLLVSIPGENAFPRLGGKSVFAIRTQEVIENNTKRYPSPANDPGMSRTMAFSPQSAEWSALCLIR
jgi:hypothetical protein